MFSFLQEHKNGLLGTLLFHLIILNLFFIFRLATTEDLGKGEILIEFDEQEEDIKQKVKDAIHKEVIISDQIDYTNYAQKLEILKTAENKYYKNKIENFNDEITPEYTNEVIKNAIGEKAFQKIAESAQKKNEINERIDNEKNEINKPDIKTNIITNGHSTLLYDLQDRYAVDLPLPVYRCENGGVVIVNINVNRNGNVVSAIVEQNDLDDCIFQTALYSAWGSKFNIDLKAPEIQKGKLIYTFIPQ